MTEERPAAPTLLDVARTAGVSTATAARALGNYGSVRASTRDRVLAAAEELGYRANGLARSMVTGSTHTLGVVLSDIENPFFSRVLRGITDVAHLEGFEVIVANTDEQPELEEAAVRVLAEKRVDGLLVCPVDGRSSEHLQAAVRGGTPLVLVDRRLRDVAADSVQVDNRAAARSATERLISAGHRRIALLTGMDPVMAPAFGRGLKGIERAMVNTTAGRAAGYRDALEASGIGVDDSLVSLEGFRLVDAVRATTSLLSRPDAPTGILALDSLLALGALQAMRELKVRCPQDVSLVGFDDADWTEAVEPPLSVVAQPVHRIGTEACQLLIERIRGSARPEQHRILRTSFVERASVAPARRHRRSLVSS